MSELYNKMCNISSDINQHLPTLKKYAEQCEFVIEMGVRYAVSTWAFIEACPKKLICYDLSYDNFKPSEEIINQECLKHGIEFEFIVGDSLKIEIDQTDLLFIDTLHTYNQLISELNRHSDKVKKWIILHDTSTFGNEDETIYDGSSDLIKSMKIEKRGLMNAINDFLLSNENWIINEVFENNNGLTILKRIKQ